MPRSMWEPWVVFRKPVEGRIHNNLGEIADAVRDACVRGYASASVATSETPGLPFRSMSDSAM